MSSCTNDARLSRKKQTAFHVKHDLPSGRKTSFSELFQGTEPPKNPWMEAEKRQRRKKWDKLRDKRRRGHNRIRARKMARKALRQGILQYKPCEMCGSNEKIEIHHLSYEPGQELNVQFLCKACHDKQTALHPEKKRTIVHLGGASCAGKTTLLNDLGIPFTRRWDVCDYYEEYATHRAETPKQVKEMMDSLRAKLNSSERVFYIETSGLNRHINTYLRELQILGHKIIRINIEPPEESTLKTKCAARGLSLEQTIKFNMEIKYKLKNTKTRDEIVKICERLEQTITM